MSIFISNIHTDLRSSRAVRRGATVRPDLVPQGLHKEYPRMPRIELPEYDNVAMSLSDALQARRSFLEPRSTEGLEISTLSSLLGHSLRKRDDSRKRPYPSDSMVYPVETYLIGNVIRGNAAGAYHYHPSLHVLEHLWDISYDARTLSTSATTPHGAALMVFTAIWPRATAAQGDSAYITTLLEAGHMAQNILLMATALGIQARPIADFDDDAIHGTLDIQTDIEQALYAITLS